MVIKIYPFKRILPRLHYIIVDPEVKRDIVMNGVREFPETMDEEFTNFDNETSALSILDTGEVLDWTKLKIKFATPDPTTVLSVAFYSYL